MSKVLIYSEKNSICNLPFKISMKYLPEFYFKLLDPIFFLRQTMNKMAKNSQTEKHFKRFALRNELLVFNVCVEKNSGIEEIKPEEYLLKLPDRGVICKKFFYATLYIIVHLFQ